MNDFTKEELQIILLDMDINIKKAPPLKLSPIYVELRNKVESIIENYDSLDSIRDRTDLHGGCNR